VEKSAQQPGLVPVTFKGIESVIVAGISKMHCISDFKMQLPEPSRFFLMKISTLIGGY
jgi:hypothetical protein